MNLDISSISDLEEAFQTSRLSKYPNSSAINTIRAGIEGIAHKRERISHFDSKKKLSFLGGILVALKEKIHTDIQLMPGKNNGPCIPAHRVILASRSKIFKQMLECEPTPDHIITLPEMNSE